MIVRENTEGEYSSVGGRDVSRYRKRDSSSRNSYVKSWNRQGTKICFELAKTRSRKKLTSATKSNGISITMPYWDERFQENKKLFQM